MVAQTLRPTLRYVDAQDDLAARGLAIAQKFKELGIDKAPLAKRAHVDRSTLNRILSGQDGVRSSSFTAVERALSELDEEMSGPEKPADSNVVRFVVRGVYGAEALVVEGPVDSIAELEASVDRIMRRLRSGGDDNP